jgi:hypothetical protein
MTSSYFYMVVMTRLLQMMTGTKYTIYLPDVLTSTAFLA